MKMLEGWHPNFLSIAVDHVQAYTTRPPLTKITQHGGSFFVSQAFFW
jgi:hypothetical protein